MTTECSRSVHSIVYKNFRDYSFFTAPFTFTVSKITVILYLEETERRQEDMGRFVNPDNSAFQVALNSKIYVDKTGLIEYTNSVLDTTDAYICNSRPRRFGKSYAANMLAAYYSKGADSDKMFSGLQISKEADFREHLNKYDVIHIDIQWFLANCEDVDNVVTLITDSVLSELREIYPDIFTWEVSRLPDALSIVREKTGQKFIIIIDEWDVLIRDAATNGNVQGCRSCDF